MSESLRPTTGARFHLERIAERGAAASYRAAIYTPDATFEATAELTDDGTATVTASGAPAELHDMLCMQAKLLARGAPSRRTDGLAAWPQRLLRWRGPGR